MSVQEMLAAMRPASETGAAAKVAEPVAITVAPPMPAKPVPVKKPAGKGAEEPATRRGFFITALAGIFTAWTMAWAAFTAAASIGGLGVLRFMLPNVLTEPPRKFKIGPPGDYDLGTVATKWVAQYGVWVVHSDQYHGDNMIYALISVCTHLGCTPSWLEGEQKFKCPCHGSGFYITGINFEGPAPRPLERAAIRIAEDGMLEVDKSMKFQEEMGQWQDSNSFVAIS
jgi:cytochrome b6-f complex iron-sulfur subunit